MKKDRGFFLRSVLVSGIVLSSVVTGAVMPLENAKAAEDASNATSAALPPALQNSFDEVQKELGTSYVGGSAQEFYYGPSEAAKLGESDGVFSQRSEENPDSVEVDSATTDQPYSGNEEATARGLLGRQETIHFVDEAGHFIVPAVEESTPWGDVNVKKHVPDGYQLVNQSDAHFNVFKHGGPWANKIINVQISKKAVTNTVVLYEKKKGMISSSEKEIKTITVSGKIGEVASIDKSQLPEGYFPAEGFGYKLVIGIGDVDSKHRVQIVKAYTNKIGFYKGFGVGKFKIWKHVGDVNVTGKEGSLVDFTIPSGYVLDTNEFVDGFRIQNPEGHNDFGIHVRENKDVKIPTIIKAKVSPDPDETIQGNTQHYIPWDPTTSSGHVGLVNGMLNVLAPSTLFGAGQQIVEFVVSFVNKITGAIEGIQKVTGTAGSLLHLLLPKGTTLSGAIGNLTTLIGAGNKLVVPILNQSQSFNPIKVLGNIFMHKPSARTRSINTFSDDGVMNGRGINPNTSWKYDAKQVIDGVTYLRVGDDNWIDAQDAIEYQPVSKTITTLGGNSKTLFKSTGNYGTRGLDHDTAWHTDRTATINGETYYRVSTDEWIAAKDVK
ncbi:SLAP domain-containing protein [Companilactobacillus mishanensis]|nr:SLAP domain-containing protein [Companilactobacillus mishanensis]